MSSAPPTDLELMMYFDGELEEPRHSEVAQFVQVDQRSVGKLTGLTVVGEAVRLEVDRRTRAAASMFTGPSSIVESVMGSIQAPAAVRPTTVQVAAINDSGGRISRAKPLEMVPSSRTGAASSRAANDNGKSIFALAGLAAAAAVALFVWGRADQVATVASDSTPTETPLTGDAPPPTRETVAITPPTQAPVANPSVASIAADDSPGVEVAAVDFGSQSGWIYVPDGDPSSANTTVVWISDD